jgi:peptide chain release factor 1
MAAVTLFDKLNKIESRYDEIYPPSSLRPKFWATPRATRSSPAPRELAQMVEKYREWKDLEKGLRETKQMLMENEDADIKQLAHDEERRLTERRDIVEYELKRLLLPRDPNDDKNVILEIRAGTGGDEAALFAAELYRMYALRGNAALARRNNGKLALLAGRHERHRRRNSRRQGLLQAEIRKRRSPRAARSRHRAAGPHPYLRRHRGGATRGRRNRHQDRAKDLRIDTFCSSGPGGQSVNTTYSAVRITHLPSGLVVSQQDEKSQIKNRAKAMRVLRARLYEMEQQKQHDQIAAERRGQIKTGDRSEKIRTYNFPQNRVTDHRIGLTLHQLTDVMDGKLAPVVDSLVTHYESERLKQELVEA